MGKKLNEALAESLYYGDYDDSFRHLRKGADPNHDTGRGITPFLFLCMTADQPELLQEMVRRGANINGRDNKGRDALHLAQTAGHQGNIEILQKLGIEAALAVHQQKEQRTPDEPISVETTITPRNLLLFSPDGWRNHRNSNRIYRATTRKMAM